jgi:hypothetical protein
MNVLVDVVISQVSFAYSIPVDCSITDYVNDYCLDLLSDDLESIRIMYNGSRIDNDDTPRTLGMENKDELVIQSSQSGGGDDRSYAGFGARETVIPNSAS